MIIVPENVEECADVSFWQGDIDWDKYPHQRVIIRIGQGVWRDSKFERNYAEAKKRNIKVGVYWFYDDRYSPKAQFETFQLASSGKSFELGVYMDWENTYGGIYTGVNNVVALMELMERDGFELGFYTGYYWFVENTNQITDISQLNYLASKKLWIASYNPPSNVQIPRPWTDWHIWQKEIRVVDWGQESKEIDVNFIKVEKESMKKIAEVKAGYNVRYRDGASTVGTNVLGTLSGGSKVIGEIVNGWFVVDHFEVDGVVQAPAVQAYMYYELTWFANISDYTQAGVLTVTHIFNDTLIQNGKTYTASFRIDDVEYHEKP